MDKKFTLSLPDTEEMKAEIEQKTAVDTQTKKVIAKTSEEQLQAMLQLDTDDTAQRKAAVQTIENFGEDAVIASNRKNAFLAKRIVAFKNNSDQTGVVADNLTRLSVAMKDLDPSGIRFSDGMRHKFFHPARKYFTKYEKTDKVIDGILEVITSGEKQLKNDNQTLLLEQEALEAETCKLNEYIALGKEFDTALSARIEQAKIEGEDEKKITFLESEVLFPLRQKVMDMSTLAVVNYQGIGAMEIIRKNNLELIRGVERAKQVSVNALRVGVMCAQALYNQNLVLGAVKTLSDSTAKMIEANAAMLQNQSGEIQEMATNPMIPVETLKQSFETVFAVFDECENYKKNALPQMEQVIAEFAAIAQDGSERLEHLKQERIA
ncbi:MAG: toxic anion resistance protein [Clostridia bacterium]|nr:toxic anion resistance protein [Clostridia bacterium]